MLADKIDHYKATDEMLHNTPAQYKSEFSFLKEVDSLALCNAQLQLQTAYKKFFRDKSIGFPKLHSKKSSRRAYTTNCINGNITIDGNCLKLPKIGLIRVKFHRQIPNTYKIKSATFSQTPSGKYYVSILTEYEADIPELTLDTSKALGLDYSSPHFYVDSQGVEADMPHFFRLAQQLRSGECNRKLFQALGKYSISVYPKHFDALNAMGALELLEDGSAILQNLSLYNTKCGLSIEIR